MSMQTYKNFWKLLQTTEILLVFSGQYDLIKRIEKLP